MANRINELRKKAVDLAEEKRKLDVQSEGLSLDRGLIKEIASGLSDEDTLFAVESHRRTVEGEIGRLGEDSETNKEARAEKVAEVDDYLSSLESNLDKLEKIKSVSDVSVAQLDSGKLEKRISELYDIRSLLDEEGQSVLETEKVTVGETGINQILDKPGVIVGKGGEKTKLLVNIPNNDTNGYEELTYLELIEKTDYTDKMRRDMEYALSGNIERKEEWDVVRGRLADEFLQEAVALNKLAESKQQIFDAMRQEYIEAQSVPNSIEKQNSIERLTQEGRKIESEIRAIKSKASYAKNMSIELSRDLDASERTIYYGVAGKQFTLIHSSLIQQQGKAVKDFYGTCGACSIANTCTLLGMNKSESEVVDRARTLKACIDKKVPGFLPETIKEQIRSSNGGTSVQGRKTILESFGMTCENATNQTLEDIDRKIQAGNGAIINVDHQVLNKFSSVSLMNPVGTNHALTITGIEKNQSGNIVGLWIHDTGVCSNMGNAFYCNSREYEVWKKTPNCVVQYVKKETMRQNDFERYV